MIAYFFGGPLDGTKKELDKFYSVYLVLKPRKLKIDFHLNYDKIEFEEIEENRLSYFPTKFAAGNLEYVCYTLNSGNGEEVAFRLFDKYFNS